METTYTDQIFPLVAPIPKKDRIYLTGSKYRRRAPIEEKRSKPLLYLCFIYDSTHQTHSQFLSNTRQLSVFELWLKMVYLHWQVVVYSGTFIKRRKIVGLLKIFCSWFSSCISFPPAPEYPIRTVSIFVQKFAEIFASQGAAPVSPTPVANLPPVSTTPAANFANNFTSVVDTGCKFATGVTAAHRSSPQLTAAHRSSRLATGVLDTGGKCKKSSIIKVLII